MYFQNRPLSRNEKFEPKVASDIVHEKNISHFLFSCNQETVLLSQSDITQNFATSKNICCLKKIKRMHTFEKCSILKADKQERTRTKA